MQQKTIKNSTNLAKYKIMLDKNKNILYNKVILFNMTEGKMMKEKVRTSFADKLKKLRIEAKRSQEELAAELGISRSCLANYETGKRQPDNEMLVRIADRFHVLTDYLVDRTKYRQLEMTSQEIEEFVEIKHWLKKRGSYLDLGALDIPGRVAVLQFYDYITTFSEIAHEVQ